MEGRIECADRGGPSRVVDIVDPVEEALLRERLDPVALGVFGDWGSGKSTILEILRRRLEYLFGVVDLVDGQPRFVANASHELRTPLAISRAAVEVQLQRPKPSEAQWRATADQVLSSTARSERLISSLLLLARIEDGTHARQRVDFAQLLAATADEMRHDVHRQGLRLDVVSSAASVQGDPDLLRRLIANLLENAVRYNIDNGWVRAELRQREGQAVLVVSNPGDRLTSQDAAEILEPFVRRSQRTRSADGTGLGLSIVASIASAHGGRVRVGARPEGGLEATVSLSALL